MNIALQCRKRKTAHAKKKERRDQIQLDINRFVEMKKKLTEKHLIALIDKEITDLNRQWFKLGGYMEMANEPNNIIFGNFGNFSLFSFGH